MITVPIGTKVYPVVITVPIGTKVYPVMTTAHRVWVAKPKHLTARVRIVGSGLVPIDVVEKFPKFNDVELWRWQEFGVPMREKGKPKKAKVIGFIYPSTALVTE